MAKINELSLYVIALVWFLFINTNVNSTLGIAYVGFTIGAALLYLLDEKKTLSFDKDGKWVGAVFVAGIVYTAFILGSSVLVSFLDKINVGGIISLLGASAPALAQSKILNFITFAIPIAFIETMFWLRLVDFFASRYGIITDKRGLFTLRGITMVLVLSFVFLMFHVTAKGITNNSGLMLTFIMMMVSLGLVFWFEEGKQAALFHIIANSISAYLIFFGGI